MDLISYGPSPLDYMILGGLAGSVIFGAIECGVAPASLYILRLNTVILYYNALSACYVYGTVPALQLALEKLYGMFTADLVPHILQRPPGPQRPIPRPDLRGKSPYLHTATRGPGGTAVQVETAYYVWGDLLSNPKVPLVVVHGGPGMTHSYMLPFALLHTDYGIPVIMYDQIGCGESTRFRDRQGDGDFWTLELFIEQLASLIGYLDLERFDILSHSWGGFLAGSFAVAGQTTSLRKLVICNSPSNLAALPLAVEQLVMQMPEQVQSIFHRCRLAQRFENAEDKAVEMYIFAQHTCRLQQPWPKELTDSLLAVAEDGTCSETMVGTSVLLMNGSISKMPGLGSRLEKITQTTCPGGMLVVTAAYDLAAHNSRSDWLTKPSLRVEHAHFEQSSHFTMFEETEALLEVVGNFLTRRV